MFSSVMNGGIVSTMATFNVHTLHTSISFNDKNKEPQISPRLFTFNLLQLVSHIPHV